MDYIKYTSHRQVKSTAGSAGLLSAGMHGGLVSTRNGSRARSSDISLSLENSDSDEGTYTFDLTGTGTVPEIAISQNLTPLSNGSGSYDFEGLTIGDLGTAVTFTIDNETGTYDFSPIHNLETLSVTFWINYDGDADSDLRLDSTPVSVSGTNSVNFNITQPGSLTIPGSGTNYTTFAIVFDPANVIASIGSFTATISVGSNDPDTDPYTFNVNGDTYYQNYSTHGTSGTGAGEFQSPYDVVYNPSNSKVYVADRMGNKVLVFASDGTYESEFGPTRTDNGNMALPEAIAVDSSVNLYVLSSGDKPSNPGFFYVQKFDEDGVGSS